MNRRMLAALTGSGVLVMILVLVYALPAAAQPWAGHMWNGNQGDPITIDDALERVTEYLDEIGLVDLAVGEVMQFENHFYAAVIDQESGDGALEVLISLDGRVVHPEPGPNMMWNAEYSPILGNDFADMHRAIGSGMMANMHGGGMMGRMNGHMGSSMMGNMSRAPGDQESAGEMPHGMMGGSMHGSTMHRMNCTEAMVFPSNPDNELDEPLTSENVADYVQYWLDAERPGITASDSIAFPGYFTLHTERDGEIIGMLSVHAETGAVWEHTWHGEFVAIDHGGHE